MKFFSIQKIWRQLAQTLFIMLLISTVWMLFASYNQTLIKSNALYDWSIEYLDGETVPDLPSAMASESWSAEGPSFGSPFATEKRKWLKVSVKSLVPYTANVHILLDNPSVDLLDFFLLEAGGSVSARRFIGDHRKLIWSSDYSIPSFQFSLNAYEQRFVYVSAVMTYANATPVMVYGDDQVREYKETLMLLWGGFLGLTLIMILYYISLFKAMRESIYTAYAIFTVMTLLYLSLLYGFGYHIVPLPIQRFLSIHIGSIGLLLMQAILMFTRNFLIIEMKKNDVVKRNKLPIVLSVLVIISFFLPSRWVLMLFVLVQPVLFLYLIVLIMKSFKERQHWARFYLFSWFPVFIGMPVSSLANIGLIESTVLTRYAFFVSVIAQLALTALSFSERMKLTEQKRIFQTTHDRYTGLANRSALIQTLNRWMNEKESFSLVFIEVRNFLRFLPYVGSERAAKLIAEVAELIRLYWKDNQDYLSSVETVNFAPPYLVRDHVLAIIVDSDKVSECMRDLFEYCNRDVTIADIEISVNPVVAGVNYPGHSKEADDLIQKAMQAIDFAKKESLDCALYLEERVQYSEQEVRIAMDLRRAMQMNELQLYHQPQIILEDFTVYGSEVLLRWNHPELGFIPPDIFVKVAEDIGMIEALTQWVMERAFIQQREIIDAGYTHQLSINISGKDVNNEDFFTNVKDLLEQYDIDGRFVTLELTESVTVKDKAALKKLMTQFESIHIRFSIDDFGTGFSSLEALSELHFTELKIDRTFVQNMTDSERNYTISSATIDLANRLKLDTVAEGVENEKVISMLKNCNCKIGQGFYFSKPIPIHEYLKWLSKQR